GQIQQTDLVADDVLVETTHGVTPWRLRAVLMKIRTSIKTGNPTSWQGLVVRSSLNFYKSCERASAERR
ncbi:hypothetical protein ACS0X7_18730, partial [Burkholderia gladioli]|uniref:hypothetical protein n=1 Tax=Burkholderia gladioli TaxID=28095 RepID=UPI003F7B2C4A